MFKFTFLLYLFAIVPLSFAQSNQGVVNDNDQPAHQFTVYKSASCGCCQKWMDHLDQHGMFNSAQHPNSLAEIKDKFAIKPQYRSCHTAVSRSGFIFEGHVPATLIKQFLKAPNKQAIGLAVPGMPIGSPGMEVGGKHMTYQVLLLMKGGSHQVYATIDKPLHQH